MDRWRDTDPSDHLSDHPSPLSFVIHRSIPAVLHQLNVVLKVQFLRESWEQVDTEALQLRAFRHGVRFFLRNTSSSSSSLQCHKSLQRWAVSLCCSFNSPWSLSPSIPLDLTTKHNFIYWRNSDSQSGLCIHDSLIQSSVLISLYDTHSLWTLLKWKEKCIFCPETCGQMVALHFTFDFLQTSIFTPRTKHVQWNSLETE